MERKKKKKSFPADFSQFCFILAHAEMSTDPLDIWREWRSSDDSDLDVLSELIRLYPQFQCPNSSFFSSIMHWHIYQTEMLHIDHTE